MAENNVTVKFQVKAVPVRNYLEDQVVPTLMQGLEVVTLTRPPNPVAYLGAYLLNNDPSKPKDPLLDRLHLLPRKSEMAHLLPRPVDEPAGLRAASIAQLPLPLEESAGSAGA